MSERKHTGGAKEFYYTKEDDKRIESEDTESTREFKKALHEWRNKKSQKAKRYFRNTKYLIKNFFRSPRRKRHYNLTPLIKNLFWLFVIGVLFNIVYSNLEKLNEVVIIFIKLGSSLLLVGVFFFVKFIFKLYKDLKYLLGKQHKWVKSLLIILLIAFLIFGYQNRNSLFDPIIYYYDKTNFGIFYPFTFSVDEGITEVGAIFESEPTNIDLIESEVLRLVNEERLKYNAGTLTSQNDLHSFARSWSEKMIGQNFFEHSNMGFSFNSYAGENIMQTPIHSSVIGCGSTYDEKNMAICIVNGWIGSPGHHKNMINPQFSTTGVGVVCDSSECKSTQVFKG